MNSTSRFATEARSPYERRRRPHDPLAVSPDDDTTEAERQISATCGWYASPPVRRPA